MKVWELPPQTRRYLGHLLQDATLVIHPGLGMSQRFWIANLPLDMFGDHVHTVYAAAILAGDSAMIPIDNRRLVLES